ncbi:hypothetical protein HBI42_239770 [Parastagonospora nodorum]|nr:hypothetical protein HBI43_238800 [Parastagonospora nodorum]KAH6242118.1 hypothetical protein HBI42_239770 [Parastagonospora nodorum]
MLTLILSKTAQQQSLSIVSNRSTALITNKFSIALLTKLAILNNANIALVDAVIDALTITLIKDNNDLLGTVNSYIKPPLKRCKTKAADSRYIKVSRRRTKKDKDLEDSNTSSNVLYLCRRDRAAASQLKKTRDKEELAKAKKEKEKKESLCKSRDSNRTLHSRRLTDAYILYFKELLSNNSRIFANFCFFSNSSLENIGRLTKEEAIKMQINTTNAISKALAATNKLTILEANTPTMHSKATKHYLALLAVDKHMFRAYNTISVTAQRTIICKGSLYIEKRVILLPSYITFNATNKRDSVTSDCIYKIEDARNIITNIKHDASEHKLSYKDILKKEGLNKLEASRRIIFNCFKMQAIASYSTLATLKAAQFKTYSSCKVKRFTLNSVKDLFTNLSKDYFLVREARAITKSSLKEKFSNKSVLVMQRDIIQHEINLKLIIVALIAFAEIITLTEATHVVIIEPQDSIVYFNLDSKLELKVLGKQDVKITS